MTSHEPATASFSTGGGGLPSSAPSPPAHAAPPQLDESRNSYIEADPLPDPTQSEDADMSSQHAVVHATAQEPAPSTSATNDNEGRTQRQALNNLMAALNQSNISKEQTITDAAPYQQINHAANESTVSEGDNYNVAVTTNTAPTVSPIQTSNSTDHLMNGSNFENFPLFPPEDALLPLQDIAMQTLQPPVESRTIGAFAKLNFSDGHYYMSTYQIELGRDAIAMQDALRRDEEEKDGLQIQAQSSSSRLSRHSDRIMLGGDSQIPGSVVSESGGFAGLDDKPVGTNDSAREPNSHPSQSSQVSDVVDPNALTLGHGFDYAYRSEELAAMEGQLDGADREAAAPVTSAHLPDPTICPLIPIHATTDNVEAEVVCHKRISRRHVRIEWSEDDESFVIEVLGRNGAFVNTIWIEQGARRLLKNGSVIQIAGVEIKFQLPDEIAREPEHDSFMSEHFEGSPERPGSITPISSAPTSERGSPAPKVTLKIPNKKPPTMPTQPHAPMLGPDGQPIIRKRGPGRPPKDGIMSTRERKEREKAAKAAEAKAANRGITPPLSKAKLVKTTSKEEPARIDADKEKKKNASVPVKRKREDEGDVIPSIEPGAEQVPVEMERPQVKKPRQSKSPSPEYPPLESLSEEQLARPGDPYARLIYDLLTEIYPRALPLKQIYRTIKLKYPFFVYRVDSEGWQSSVRHNLNQEWNKLFEKGDKEGKGFAWKAIPGAMQPQAERKRAAQQAAASKPKPPQQPRQNGPNGGPQQPPYWSPNGYPPPGNTGTWQAGAAPGPAARPYTTSGQLIRTAAPAREPPPLPALAASNMPCTLDGIVAVMEFEKNLRDQRTRNPGKTTEAQLTAVLNSVKARLLHGAPVMIPVGSESDIEKVIAIQISMIIEEHKNPTFAGFQLKPLSRGQSPAVTGQAPPVPGPANGIIRTPANAQGRPPNQLPPRQQFAPHQQPAPGARPPSAGSATPNHQYPPPQMPQQHAPAQYPRNTQMAQQTPPNNPNINGVQHPQQSPNTSNAYAGPLPGQTPQIPPSASSSRPVQSSGPGTASNGMVTPQSNTTGVPSQGIGNPVANTQSPHGQQRSPSQPAQQPAPPVPQSSQSQNTPQPGHPQAAPPNAGQPQTPQGVPSQPQQQMLQRPAQQSAPTPNGVPPPKQPDAVMSEAPPALSAPSKPAAVPSSVGEPVNVQSRAVQQPVPQPTSVPRSRGMTPTSIAMTNSMIHGHPVDGNGDVMMTAAPASNATPA